ncbi:early light-induced protein 1, chloroplastic-like [Dorcoceras hygrometricum]|uniref:Early light-induced protein 1, chloroplastic-like n=1 Tax=Dorcoceras hygrometricum TaxID=472368 RepID=A0A2Z7B5E8_9LAMI|nr:early light-induced protein 1, chloroplastic-like [Dorcoceras hygrometricum]
MAATGMQVISGAGLSSRIVGRNQFASVPIFRRDLKFRIRSTAEDGNDVSDEKERAAVPIAPRVFSTPPPRPQPEESTKFTDIMAFDGPAAERVNGRLAMLGFTTAIAVELTRGQDLFTQIQSGGLKWFIVTTLLFSVASLIPLFRGVSADSTSKPGGLMSSDAELWNGRAAMVGLVALAYTEYLTGGPLV